MSEFVDLIAVLKKRMAEFSKGQRQVARYIISNYDKASYMTAAQLGENAGVSESTVVRFAHEMGFRGYPEFCCAMAEYVRSRLKHGRYLNFEIDLPDTDEIADFIADNDINHIKALLSDNDRKNIEAAAEMIINAKCIYILGLKECNSLAIMLANNLNIIKGQTVLLCDDITNVFSKMLHITSDDVVIGFSFPRYSKQIIKVLEYANAQNSGIIAITDTKYSPVALYSSCNLYAQCNMSSITGSFSAVISLINMLTISVYVNCRDKLLDNFYSLERIIEDYQECGNDELDILNPENIKEFK